jgi:protein-disulfide isomerase
MEGTSKPMSKNLRISLVMAAVAGLVIVGAFLLGRSDREPADVTGASKGSAQLLRADSHRLTTAPDGKVTFIEFVDFECESCKAASGAVDELRKKYEGRVTFVVKYFPNPGHFNAERSARAVEAAAQQGQFEPMFQKMFATQLEWGGKHDGAADVPADATFRGYAADLKLDMAAYDKAYDDPGTLKRVRQDLADGKAFGVTGTPTFFLDGKMFDPTSYEHIVQTLDAALAS